MSAGQVRQVRSIHHVHYDLLKPSSLEEMAKPCYWTLGQPELHKYGTQIAGHQKTDGDKYLGLLQCNNGTLLKPIVKEAQKREIDFYERVNKSEDNDLKELKNFIPKYYGSRKFVYQGYENDYLILEDLTDKMGEPCAMDAKIGRRTWDPLATEEKIRNEQSKYADCKREVAFCIPGFQVYKLSTGKVHKYGKEYGKKLNGTSVKEAIKIFLNGSSGALCRSLILQFLTELWKIQKWASKQNSLKLYSSSLLLIYDAQKLKECCKNEPDILGSKAPSKCSAAAVVRKKSVTSINSPESTGSNFSGQINSKGPVYKKIQSPPITSMALAQASFAPHSPIKESPWAAALNNLNRSHSFENNYEEKLSKIKTDYKSLLEQLSSDGDLPCAWGKVKIIDFAHAFFEDSDSVDSNFSEGIDNFVSIFEEFLSETDDQVF